MSISLKISLSAGPVEAAFTSAFFDPHGLAIVRAEAAAGRIGPAFRFAQVHRDARSQHAAEQGVGDRQRHEVGLRRIDDARTDAQRRLRRIRADRCSLTVRGARVGRRQLQAARSFAPCAERVANAASRRSRDRTCPRHRRACAARRSCSRSSCAYRRSNSDCSCCGRWEGLAVGMIGIEQLGEGRAGMACGLRRAARSSCAGSSGECAATRFPATSVASGFRPAARLRRRRIRTARRATATFHPTPTPTLTSPPISLRQLAQSVRRCRSRVPSFISSPVRSASQVLIAFVECAAAHGDRDA